MLTDRFKQHLSSTGFIRALFQWLAHLNFRWGYYTVGYNAYYPISLSNVVFYVEEMPCVDRILCGAVFYCSSCFDEESVSIDYASIQDLQLYQAMRLIRDHAKC